MGHPVLMIHGWLDNAGSFDPIIPHLLSVHNLHIVAVDEPGCGLSSHKPPGSDYNRWAHLRELKRIVDQLNWTEVTLVGHSLGMHHLIPINSLLTFPLFLLTAHHIMM